MFDNLNKKRERDYNNPLEINDLNTLLNNINDFKEIEYSIININDLQKKNKNINVDNLDNLYKYILLINDQEINIQLQKYSYVNFLTIKKQSKISKKLNIKVTYPNFSFLTKYSNNNGNNENIILETSVRNDGDYETYYINTLYPIINLKLKFIPLSNKQEILKISQILLFGVIDEKVIKLGIEKYKNYIIKKEKLNWLDYTRNLSFNTYNPNELNNFIKNIENDLVTQFYNNLILGNYLNSLDNLNDLNKKNLLKKNIFKNKYNEKYNIEFKKIKNIDQSIKKYFNYFSEDLRRDKVFKKQILNLQNNNNQKKISDYDSNKNLIEKILFFDYIDTFDNISQFIPKNLHEFVNDFYLNKNSYVIDEKNNIIYFYIKKSDKNFYIYNFITKQITSNKILISNDYNYTLIFDDINNKIYFYGIIILKTYSSNSKVILYEYNINTNNLKNLNTSKILIKGNFYNILEHNEMYILMGQICLDKTKNFLIFSGGYNILTKKCNGIYKYDIINQYFIDLYSYDYNNNDGNIGFLKIINRFGHKMLFDSNKNEIYIIGGCYLYDENIINLYDIMIYNLDSNKISEYIHDYTINNSIYENFFLKGDIYCGKDEYNNINNKIILFDGGNLILDNEKYIFKKGKNNFYLVDLKKKQKNIYNLKYDYNNEKLDHYKYSDFYYNFNINKGYLINFSLEFEEYNIGYLGNNYNLEIYDNIYEIKIHKNIIDIFNKMINNIYISYINELLFFKDIQKVIEIYNILIYKGINENIKNEIYEKIINFDSLNNNIKNKEYIIQKRKDCANEMMLYIKEDKNDI